MLINENIDSALIFQQVWGLLVPVTGFFQIILDEWFYSGMTETNKEI